MTKKLIREILELMAEWPDFRWKARNLTAKIFNQSRIGQKVTPALQYLRKERLIKRHPKRTNNGCYEYSITEKGKSRVTKN